MDFNFIIQRVIGILTKPVDEWKKIKGEQATVAGLFTNYAIILAAIPAIAGFLGLMIVGFPIRFPFTFAIANYIFSLLGVFLLALVIDNFAPIFDSNKNMTDSTKIAVYSYTPTWVAGIFYIIPQLGMVAMIAGFYSLYLLYLGIKEIKAPSKAKEAGYFVSIIVANVIIGIVVYFLIRSIAFSGYYSIFSRY
ncbi:MAG: Yip1 family protein [Acidobacteriota bacterium]